MIRALFQYFFLRKLTSEAHLSNFIFDAFKERSIMVYFKKKIFKRRADQKLRCPNFHFWNAHISLVDALILTCSNPLRPCCQCRFSNIMMQNCLCIAALSPKGLVIFRSIQFLVKRWSFFGHLVPEYPLVYTILTNWIQDRFNVQNWILEKPNVGKWNKEVFA